MGIRTFSWGAKDPTAQETYEFDWANYLGAGENVVTSAAVTDTGSDVVVQSQTMIGVAQQVTLSGGTVRGPAHVVLLSITTSFGNAPRRRVRIKVRKR